jgi:hypothetical protein
MREASPLRIISASLHQEGHPRRRCLKASSRVCSQMRATRRAGGDELKREVEQMDGEAIKSYRGSRALLGSRESSLLGCFHASAAPRALNEVRNV